MVEILKGGAGAMGNGTKSKEHLGLAAEFAVASQLCRMGLYAQLTLGRHKSIDILIESGQGKMLRVQVKAKNGREWPNCKGVPTKDIILVLVDLFAKDTFERPDFYILDEQDWVELANKEIALQRSRGREVVMADENIPVWPKQISPKSGQPYSGFSIKQSQVISYKEKWEKIVLLLHAS